MGLMRMVRPRREQNSMKRLMAIVTVLGLAVVVPARASQPPKPRLVVLVIIDQFRGDYLARWAPYFSKDGLGRLIHKGAWFDNAYYTYGALATGPGHASLSTGATPSVHGIVGNDWYAQPGRTEIYCCADPNVHGVGYPDGKNHAGRSPANMRSDSLGDLIKSATAGRGQVWGVALKDRAAILSTGTHADGAIWWDSSSGRLVSSTYYGDRLPDAIDKLNGEHFVDRFFKTRWTLLQSADVYHPGSIAGRSDPAAYGRTHTGRFPKIIGAESDHPDRRYYRELYITPMANELVFEAAKRLVATRSLGSDGDVDLLVVGLSANDVVGHRYGPESAEVMDCTLRTDRQLAAFFTWLDQRVGLDNCLVGLSSDHGVGPIVEYSEALGLGGGRFDSRGLVKKIDKALNRRFGAPAHRQSYVVDLLLPWLYLDEQAISASGGTVDEAARIAADVAAEYEGVAETFTKAQIVAPGFAVADTLRGDVAHSYYPKRSGQVYIHWRRYWYKQSKLAGHGAAYDYDKHVPVVLMGPGVRPGRYGRRVRPTDLTVTICKLLGIESAASMTGRVLSDAIADPVATAQPGNTGAGK